MRRPGVLRLACAYVIMGVGGTMGPVTLVLFARAVTHSLPGASLVLAANTAGGLLVGPLRGRLVDRLGPSRAVLRLAVPSLATDVAFILAGRGGVPAAVLVLLAGLAGAISAPASTALRTVWSRSLEDPDSRHAGYALMAMLTETSYIGGPLLAGGLIGAFSSTTAVAVMTGLGSVGALVFATAPSARAVAPQPAQPGRLPALEGAGIRTVVALAGAFGLTFGLLDVAFPAFARAHGSAAFAGVLLSAFAVGSWLGGYLYGLRGPSGAPGPRHPWLCLLAAAGFAPLVALPSLAAMALLAGLSGVCFAPVSVAQIAVLDDVAPAAHRAEAYTWMGTLYGTGLAAGAAVSGQLVAAAGVRAAIGVALGAVLLATLVAGLRVGTLAPAPDASPSQSVPVA